MYVMSIMIMLHSGIITWWKIRSNILNADKMLLNDEYDEELFVDSSETFSIAFTEPFQLLRNFSTT